MKPVVVLVAAALACVLPEPARAAPEIVSVDTRPGVTVRVLLLAPAGPPSATLLMFPGGLGNNPFAQRDGEIRLGGNFVVRTAPLFTARGLLVAVIDTPSDLPQGMDDSFRMGKAHVEDVRKVLGALTQRAPVPVYLTATSRGTLSGAALAAVLKDPRVAGLVLTSSIADSGRGRNRAATVFDLPLKRITMPVLVVHHRHDGCWATPIGAASGLPAALSGSARVDFVEVEGGDPPRSEPCGALSAHGYVGREREVVAVIADWVAGKPVPKQVP
jgi:pimeloyl-ACP methyl ester carboxylesterase